MKRLLLLTSLAALFVLSSVPALAQETSTQPEAAFDQYGPGGLGGPDQAADAAKEAVEDLVSKGKEADGAAAYEAALNAAREAGADAEAAEVVAAEVVAEVSEGPGITELPDTSGASVYILTAGLLIGAGLLVRRLF